MHFLIVVIICVSSYLLLNRIFQRLKSYEETFCVTTGNEAQLREIPVYSLLSCNPIEDRWRRLDEGLTKWSVARHCGFTIL